MARLKPAEQARLKMSQRKWVEARDSADALSYDLVWEANQRELGGTMLAQVVEGAQSGLKVPRVRERALWLRELIRLRD
jgi:uncharacterized protein YecT (DUF1311 family)